MTALLLAGAPAAAALTHPAGTATVSLSSNRTGAAVALTLKLSYAMQCGYPGPGPVLVEFPAQERVPGAIAAATVLVDGKRALGVRVSGHTVKIGLAPPPQVLCDLIAPGRLTIVLTRSAGLRNPTHAGRYTITASRKGAALSAGFTVRPG